MEKEYFSPILSGGAVNSKGISYQDLVSLLYLFKHINNQEFLEITFESYDDFTLIMENHEVFVQVKNTHLSVAQIQKILKTKSEISKYRSIKHVVVASGYNSKCRILLDNLKSLNNFRKTNRKEDEKDKYSAEFHKKLEGIDPELFEQCKFEEVSRDQVIQAIKFYMYDWTIRQHWEVDIDDWFNNLITRISVDLRPFRGSLKRKEIEDLAINCPKKSYITYGLPNTATHYFDNSKESILQSLTKEINENSEFLDRLTLIKLYIEKNSWNEALQHAIKIFNIQHETYKYYYLWLLYKLEKYEELSIQCNQLIKQKKYLYYSFYFTGLIYITKGDLPKAIFNFKQTLNIENTFEVNIKLAQLYYEMNNIKNSLEHYRYCLSIKPLDANLLIEVSPLLPPNEAIASLDKALDINSNLHRAYFEKGKILRYYGLNEEAYEYFKVYLGKNANIEELSNEVSKEISLCLLSLKNESAFNYMNNWLPDFLYSSKNEKVKSGEIITIIGSYWKETHLITCTKYGEDYVIRTSIRDYVLIKPEKSTIAIGCVQDFFLKMSADLFRKYNKKVDDGSEYIPAILKFYGSKNEFEKVIKSMKLNENTYLNKDDSFQNDMDNSWWQFKEYISKNGTTSLQIEELQNAFHVLVKVGTFFITGWFQKGGEGYFKFCQKIEQPSGFHEVVLVLECFESKEVVHVKFNVNDVKIKKITSFSGISLPREIEFT
ncbi:hypothetical protein SAMN05428987_5261 [Paenibacillus sp. CF095]|uniref:tetratricopeptide repeat protein n=1 Tax=Paenibacillus sp. CF095 TaxID=1881033 RepID=UPI00088AD3CC|nr:tetratricopeptide repeat protein [Paenibacillus sp. CF095]SDD55216.1 hypothetical protein SAMN05428987_5261 [Paenibacillus sp. CF095]